jgi:hypothetical protein
MKLTLTNVRKELRRLDIVITHVDDEYRVNFRGGSEATAYYTNDLQDAFDTGRAMRRMFQIPPLPPG